MDAISVIGLAVGCAVLLLVIIIFACGYRKTCSADRQDALDREALLKGSRLTKKRRESKIGDLVRKKSVTFSKQEDPDESQELQEQEYPDESQEQQEQSQDTSYDKPSSFPGQYQESNGSHSFPTAQQNESNQSDFSPIIPEVRGYNMDGSCRSYDANSRQNLQKQTYTDDGYRKRHLNSGMTVKQIVEKVKNGSDKNMHTENGDTTSNSFYDNNTDPESCLCHDCFRYINVDEQTVTDEGTSNISSSIGYDSSGQIQNRQISKQSPTPYQEKHIYDSISKEGLSYVNRDKFALMHRGKIALRSAPKIPEGNRPNLPKRYSLRRASCKEHCEPVLSSGSISKPKQLSRSKQQFVPMSSTPINPQMCQHRPKLIPAKQPAVVVPPLPSKSPLTKPQQSSNANAQYQQSSTVITRHPPELPSTKHRSSTMAQGRSELPSTQKSPSSKDRPHLDSLLTKLSNAMARPKLVPHRTKQSSAAAAQHQSELLPTNQSLSIATARHMSEPLARKQPPTATVNPPSELTPAKQTPNMPLEVPATKQAMISKNSNPSKFTPTKLYSRAQELTQGKQSSVATGMSNSVARALPLANTSLPSTKVSPLPISLQPPTLPPTMSPPMSVSRPPPTTPGAQAPSPQLILPPEKEPLLTASSQQPLYPTKGTELLPRKQAPVTMTNPPSELTPTKQAPNENVRTALQVRATKQPTVPMTKSPTELPQAKHYSSPSAVLPLELTKTKQSLNATGMSISVAPQLSQLPLSKETIKSMVSPPLTLTKASVLPVPSPPTALAPTLLPVTPDTPPPLPPRTTPVVRAPPPQLLLPPTEASFMPMTSAQLSLSPTQGPHTPNLMSKNLLEVPVTKDLFILKAKRPPELTNSKQYKSAPTKQSSNATEMFISVAPPLSQLPLTNTTFMAQTSPPPPSTKALVLSVPSPPSPVRTTPVVRAPPPQLLLPPAEAPFIPVASAQLPSSPTKGPQTPNVMSRNLLEVPVIKDSFILKAKRPPEIPQTKQYTNALVLPETKQSSNATEMSVATPLSTLPLTNTTFMSQTSPPPPSTKALVLPVPSPPSPVRTTPVVLAPSPKMSLPPTKVPYVPVASWQPPLSPKKEPVTQMTKPAPLTKKMSNIIAKFELLATEKESKDDLAQVTRKHSGISPVDQAQAVRKDSVRSSVNLVRNRSAGSPVDLTQVVQNHSEGRPVDQAQVARYHLDGRGESKTVPDLEKQQLLAKECDSENSMIVISGNRGQAVLRNTNSDFASDMDFAPITASTPQQSTAALRNSISEFDSDIDFQPFKSSTPIQSTAALRNSISDFASDIDIPPFPASTPPTKTTVVPRNSISRHSSDMELPPFPASSPQQSSVEQRNNISKLASDMDLPPFPTPQQSTTALRNNISKLASDMDLPPFPTPQQSTEALRNNVSILASDMDLPPFPAPTPQQSTAVSRKADIDTKEIVHSNRSILHSHLQQRRLRIKDSSLDASGFAETVDDSFWDDSTSISPVKKSASVDDIILSQEKEMNSISEEDFVHDKIMTKMKSSSSTTVESTSSTLIANLEDKMASVKNIRDDPAVRALLADIKARRTSYTS